MSRTPASIKARLAQSRGYTIDQTILIVAIIAILVTLIIITVGWNLINKSSGTKLAAQMKQVEDANGSFFSTYRLWPHQSYSGTASAANNVVALTGTGVTYLAQITGNPDAGKNFIPGFRVVSGVAQHNFGSSGAINQTALTNPYGNQGTYLVIQFANVPFSEAQQAERAIDGNTGESYSGGRFVASTGATCLAVTVATPATTATTASTPVTACYAANMVQ